MDRVARGVFYIGLEDVGSRVFGGLDSCHWDVGGKGGSDDAGA